MMHRIAHTHSAGTIGEALQLGVATLRETLGDPFASIAVVASARPNAELARREMAAHGGVMRVRCVTADEIIASFAREALIREELRPQPANWMQATLATILPEMIDDDAMQGYGEVLARPGWRATLAGALGMLEDARISPDQLRALPVAPHHARRLAIVAHLLETLDSIRRHERIASPARLAAAAQAHAGDTHGPFADVQGLLVVGEKRLTAPNADAMAQWLATRAVMRVVSWPLEQLPRAMPGLRALCADAPTVAVQQPTGAVGHLQGSTFVKTSAPCHGWEETVTFAHPLDDVREVREIVRRVQMAIDEGTALDRIAIALPDTTHADRLETLLADAEIPATFLTGPALTRAAGAQFLRLAVRIATGEEDDPVGWWRLLSQPGMIASRRAGLARWRGLLGAVPRGTPGHLLPDAIRAVRQERLEDLENDDDEERARIQAAASGLLSAITEIHAVLATWHTPRSLGRWAICWRDFLRTWWRADSTRRRVLRALEGWGADAQTMEVSLETAGAMLEQTLTTTPQLKGTLGQAAVRVLEPAMLLGGSFEVVIAASFVQGTFPAEVREDALIDDALIEVITEQTGASLVDTDAARHAQHLRLASILGAATEHLWISVPRYDLSEASPTIPSPFALRLLSTLTGHPAKFSDLQAILDRDDVHATALPGEANDAISEREHLLSAARHKPEEVMRQLAAHPFGRRLMHMHRRIDRGLAQTSREALLEANRAPMEAWGDTQPWRDVQSAWDLAQMIQDPHGAFFETILGAHPTRRPRRAEDPLRELPRTVRRLIDAAREDEGAALPEAFAARLDQHLTTTRARIPSLDAAPRQVALMHQLGMQLFEELTRHHTGALTAPPATLHEPLTLSEDLAIKGSLGQTRDGRLVRITSGSASSRNLRPTSSRTGLAMGLQALALRDQGEALSGVEVIGVKGGHATRDLDTDDLRAWVDRTQRMLTLGWWPVTNADDPWAMQRERDHAGDLDLDAILNAEDDHD